MISDTEYLRLISEEYDLSNYNTKKKLLFCNEANKAANIEHIVTRLYEHIRSNSTGIDFGSIPKSKGNITKVENYDKMIDCINSISELVTTYKDPTNTVQEIYTAINNIHNRERSFTKAFTLNIEFPIMIYNITVNAIVSAISLLISSSIEFIKNGHDSFSVSFDKIGYYKSKDHLMFEYLTQFNRNCNNGTIDKIINECIKNNITSTNESVVEESEEIVEEGFKDAIDTTLAVAGTIAGVNGIKALKNTDVFKKGAQAAVKFAKNNKVASIAIIIIGIGITAVLFVKLIAWAIAFILRMRMKVSDWFEIQAEYLQINAENLKYRDDPKGLDHRKDVYQRQMKWVDRFKAVSNTLALKDSKVRKSIEEDSSRVRDYEEDEEEYGYSSGSLF